MSKRPRRQLLRQARRLAKRQQAILLALEVEGLVALTLRSATRELTIAVERPIGAQLIGELTEFLHDRRQALRAELRQLRRSTPSIPAPADAPAAQPAPPAAAES